MLYEVITSHDPIAALAFCFVEGVIGILEELFRGLPVEWEHSNTNGDGDGTECLVAEYEIMFPHTFSDSYNFV